MLKETKAVASDKKKPFHFSPGCVHSSSVNCLCPIQLTINQSFPSLWTLEKPINEISHKSISLDVHPCANDAGVCIHQCVSGRRQSRVFCSEMYRCTSWCRCKRALAVACACFFFDILVLVFSNSGICLQTQGGLLLARCKCCLKLAKSRSSL